MPSAPLSRLRAERPRRSAGPCGAEGAAPLPLRCGLRSAARGSELLSVLPPPAASESLACAFVGRSRSFPWIVLLFSRSPSRLSSSLGTFRALLSRPSHLFRLCSFGEKKNIPDKTVVNALSLLCSVLCKLCCTSLGTPVVATTKELCTTTNVFVPCLLSLEVKLYFSTFWLIA